MEKVLRALLLTDIVDSTKLVESLGTEAAAELWTAHDAAARDLLRVWRGREIDKTDGFLMCFESAVDAAAYAIAYHAAVAELAVELDLKFEARAGLHVGEVLLRENAAEDVARGAKPVEVEGLAKPLAARVMSLAMGAQTLLTESARDALRKSALRMESHGHWRMKGVSDPVELLEIGDGNAPWQPPPDGQKVYQVVRDGDDWKPVKDVPHNLPRERDRFVGRKVWLSKLAKLMDDEASLVTVVGTGGTGKTRLTCRYARSWLGDFPGGAWFCDLAEAHDLDSILNAVATALNVPLPPRGADRQLANAIMGRGRCLILLDNFEQVIDEGAELLNDWIVRAPEARFLVTSREALRLPGERVLELAPLPEPEALALFEARAQAQRADFLAKDEDADELLAIVRTLDGLPLAIELAAARIRGFSVAGLRRALEERFALLAGARGVSRRQSALKATIDWSWNLLEAWERASLAQCSAFAGGFEADSADAVVELESWPDAGSASAVLQALADRSLLQRASGRDDECSSYRMLASIQEYAAEKLREPDAYEGSGPEAKEGAWRRHGEYFSRHGSRESVAALSRHGGIARLRALRRHFPNLLVACRRAMDRADNGTALACLAACRPIIDREGPFTLGVELVDRLLDASSLTAAQRARLLILSSYWRLVAGDLAEACRQAEAALLLARGERSRELEATALGGWGFAELRRGHLVEAREHLEASIAIREEVGERQQRAISLDHLAYIAAQEGRREEEDAHYALALKLDREIGHRQHEGAVLGHVAISLHLSGRTDEAGEMMKAALAIHREAGDRRFEANELGNLGLLCADTGRLAEARTYLEEALVGHREVGNRAFEAQALTGLARNHATQGRMDEARRHFDAALVINREIDDPRGEGEVLQGLADLLSAGGRLDEGIAHARQALALHREVGDRWFEACDLGELGAMYLAAGQLEDSRESLTAAHEIITQVGDPAIEGVIKGYLGELATAEGEYAQARPLLDRAKQLLEHARDRLELGLLACKRTSCERLAGDLDAARAALDEAEAHREAVDAGPASRLGCAVERERSALASTRAREQ